MARWKLTATHYLNVEGIEWEYKETDRDTGRQRRKQMPVPLLLNPDDPNDHNYKHDEMIVVSDGVNPGPRDIIFSGPPTPDMEPLDDLAMAISQKESPKWVHPIESLPGQSFSASLLSQFEKQLASQMAEMPKGTPYAKGVDPDAFKALQEQVSELVKQNTQLIQLLSQRATEMPHVPNESGSVERRV